MLGLVHFDHCRCSFFSERPIPPRLKTSAETSRNCARKRQQLPQAVAAPGLFYRCSSKAIYLMSPHIVLLGQGRLFLSELLNAKGNTESVKLPGFFFTSVLALLAFAGVY